MATKNVFSSRATMFRTVIAAAVCAASAVSPTLADVNITEDVALDADADWRGQGVVNIAQGATLDLRGHSLRVSGIAGDGTITSDYGITPPVGALDRDGQLDLLARRRRRIDDRDGRKRKREHVDVQVGRPSRRHDAERILHAGLQAV